MLLPTLDIRYYEHYIVLRILNSNSFSIYKQKINIFTYVLTPPDFLSLFLESWKNRNYSLFSPATAQRARYLNISI